MLVGLLACQKPTDGLQPGDSTKPEIPSPIPGQSGVVYEKGTPIGGTVQKTIGPEGGTLASADGVLNMTIPAGAVSKATIFSIQPVTPTLPGLIGQQSYRLLPEGQTFAQPVTLRYQYHADSLDGTSEQLLFMAYQGNDGYWKALPGTELDETTHLLTVKTKHFSDWGAFAEFVLKSDRDVLAPGESAQLNLEGYTFLSPELSGEAIEIPLARIEVLKDPKNINNWRVQGQGYLTVEQSQTAAIYSVPENATGGSSLVSVDVYNFVPPNLRPRQGATGKSIMLKKIRINGSYFQATVDGKTYDLFPLGVVNAGGIQFMSSFGSNKTLMVQIRAQSVTSSSRIPYGTFHKGLDGTAFIYLTDGGNWPYASWHPTCDGDPVASDGSVYIEISTTEKGMRFIQGSLTGTLYGGPDNCINLETRKISAKFRIPLTDG